MPDALDRQDVAVSLDGPTPAPAGSGVAPEAVQFDFRHPPRIAKDHRATLEAIFGQFAMSAQAFFSSRCRTPADVVVSSIEQATYHEFTFSLTSPCATVVFDLHADGQQLAAMDLGADFAFYLVDRLFGGPGELQTIRRPLTPLEQTVIRGVADRLLTLLKQGFEEDFALEPTYVGFEATPDAVVIAENDDIVLVVNLEVRTGLFNGPIAICIPLHAIESFLQRKSRRPVQPHVVPPQERAATRSLLEGTLRCAQLAVIAIFSPFKIKARELAELRPGQVVHTGHHLEAPVELYVNGRRRFTASVGQIHRNLGLRISQPIRKSQRGGATRTPRGRVL